MLEGDPLWHQFADDQREIGDHDHHGQHTDLVAVAIEKRNPAEQVRKGLGKRGATERAVHDADQGNPDLHRGKESGWVCRELDRRPGPTNAVGGALFQTGCAGRDDSQFGHREESVDDDQEEDNDEL